MGLIFPPEESVPAGARRAHDAVHDDDHGVLGDLAGRRVEQRAALDDEVTAALSGTWGGGIPGLRGSGLRRGRGEHGGGSRERCRTREDAATGQPG